jgi:hypothetical protein
MLYRVQNSTGSIYGLVVGSCDMEYNFRTFIDITDLGGRTSKTGTVFARSNVGIVGSNPTQGMVVCVGLLCVCVVLCVGSGLAIG